MNKPKYRIHSILLFFTYATIILWYTVFGRSITLKSARFEIFWSYKEWFQGNWGIGNQIILNIILFIPFGFLHASITKKYGILEAVLSGLLISCLIEILQYLLVRGLFEFDDVLNNTIGACIGGILYAAIRKKMSFPTTQIVVKNIGIISVLIGFAICLLSDTTETDISSTQYCFQIDDVSYNDNTLCLSGFGFVYDETDNPIQLKLRSALKTISLDVESGMERQDVESYFLCDTDYSHSGFTAIASEVDEEEEYEILVNIGWPMALPTGIYITGSNVHYTPSVSFNLPDIDADFLNKGTLRVYRPDYHCWVYQYNGSLYWIVDEDFYFEEDGSTRIQYHLWTTQPERLPSHRVENNWISDNISDNFEDYELHGKYGSYRVMKRELPTNYSITSIETGYYRNGEWIWQNLFRPYYEF